MTVLCLVLQERQLRILRAENEHKDMLIQMLEVEQQALDMQIQALEEELLAGKAAAAA